MFSGYLSDGMSEPWGLSAVVWEVSQELLLGPWYLEGRALEPGWAPPQACREGRHTL